MEKTGFKYSWGKFYWDAWLNDINLQSCDLAVQGLWMNLIAIMHKSEQIGYLVINGRPMTVVDIAKRVGIRKDRTERLLQKLIENDVCSVTHDGVLYCRRIVREEKRRNPTLKNYNAEVSLKKNDNQLKNKEMFSDYRQINQGEKNVSNISQLYENTKKKVPAVDILNHMEMTREDIKSNHNNYYYELGSRLPYDWYPDQQCYQFACDLHLCPEEIVEDFRDYWHAKVGKEAIKMDWAAAWRRWCRIASQWKKNCKVTVVKKKKTRLVCVY